MMAFHLGEPVSGLCQRLFWEPHGPEPSLMLLVTPVLFLLPWMRSVNGNTGHIVQLTAGVLIKLYKLSLRLWFNSLTM